MKQPTDQAGFGLDLPLTAQGRVDGRSARKVETRRRIITAASELFAEQGYTGTSMDQIAEAAGVSKGTIFYNYKNKSELFEQLIRAAALTIAEEMERARAGLRGWEALNAATWAVVKAVSVAPAPAQIVVTELFRTQRTWAASLDESRRILMRPMVEIFGELAEDRHAVTGTTLLPSDQLPNVAMSVLGALVVATLDRLAFSPERPLEAVHQVLMQAISGVRV
ncbi:TetR/AcrR family transcriptional regulator [Luteococcus peritonei]|uniref:TetR/AcrR family transcriptional regulator n=1 Tax=Luteococcus peritonei TaxID=88874 RepID=A0ABW4RU83_9ACTN